MSSNSDSIYFARKCPKIVLMQFSWSVEHWLQYEKVSIQTCWPNEKLLWRFCQNFKEIEKKVKFKPASLQACSAGSEVGVLTNKLRKWHEWALWGVKCLNFGVSINYLELQGSSVSNVWCIKIRTKDSSKRLLSLVRFLMHQTLYMYMFLIKVSRGSLGLGL